MTDTAEHQQTLLETLTPQEREALAATLARVVDTMVSR